jgi:hypothetical protein
MISFDRVECIKMDLPAAMRFWPVKTCHYSCARDLLLCFTVVAIVRTIYVLLGTNEAGDSHIYIDIARNLADGNGFALGSLSKSSGLIEVVGGYMPGYPAFLAAVMSLNLTPKVAVLIICWATCLAILLLSSTLYTISGSRQLSISNMIILGLSPWGVGFTRLLLIEPLISLLGVILLVLLLRLIWRIGKASRTYFSVIVVLVLMSLLKPTFVIFFPPVALALLMRFGLRKALPRFLILILVVIMCVSPWGVRNKYMGANELFPRYSNIFPENIGGYGEWVGSWAITEYQYSAALFPAWTGGVAWPGSVNNILLTKTPFIGEQEIQDAERVLYRARAENKFSDETDSYFRRQVLARSAGVLSWFQFALLRFLQAASLLLHPANSWGWPVELPSTMRAICAEVSLFDCVVKSVPLYYSQMSLKAILFTWRLIAYCLVLYGFSRIFVYSRCVANGRVVLSRNPLLGLSLVISLMAIILVFANLLLFIGIVQMYEHYYFFPCVSWVETGAICVVALMCKWPYQYKLDDGLVRGPV